MEYWINDIWHHPISLSVNSYSITIFSLSIITIFELPNNLATISLAIMVLNFPWGITCYGGQCLLNNWTYTTSLIRYSSCKLCEDFLRIGKQLWRGDTQTYYECGLTLFPPISTLLITHLESVIRCLLIWLIYKLLSLIERELLSDELTNIVYLARYQGMVFLLYSNTVDKRGYCDISGQ